MGLATLSANIGKGLAAGILGTAAMTVSSTLEAKLRNRGSSSAPVDAASAVLGIETFSSDQAEQRFGQLVHWGYGTQWGAVRGLLRSLGFGPNTATVLHGAVVYGTEQAMLPALDVAPPATEWGVKEIAIDAFHHTVYVMATASVYEWLDGRGRRA
jgi:hypothetical protein